MSGLRSYCYKFIVALSIFIYVTNPDCLSQYYTAGIDPASVRWRQINTPHFKVIYPLTFAEHAQYLANGLEYVYLADSRTIKSLAPRLPVIIHNQTTIPSSVTPYAPERSDFFTAPPQDMYPQDWVDQLIIHEFRHAVQYSAVNHGFTKALSYILGEQGTFATVIFFLPLWFIEGDATVAETALHYTGRGRTPSFEMRLRTQFVQKGIYSYEKQYSGSYRDFVPGKYELGYQLVGLSRDIFGPYVWSEVLNNVGRHPYTLVPFSSAIKRQTGFNKYGLYDTLTQVMQKNWLNEDKMIHENNHQVLSKASGNEYTSYNLPVIFRDSLIIAVKSSLDDLTKIVLLNKNGNEKKLFATGVNYLLESLSASDSILYWSEMTNDPRWSFRDYRVIKSFRYNTGKTEQLTHCTRYYAPSVTSDGKLIAAVEVTLDNKYFLVILNSKDGGLIKKISTPDNLLFIHPRWAADGRSIVTVVFGKDGNTLAIADPETGKIELLLPYSHMEIKRPSFYSNYVIYTASYNGIDNIYAFDRNTRDVFKVTSARFGACDAFVTNDQSYIIYSNYTSDGYKLVKENLDPATWEKISIPAKSVFPLAEKLTLQENFIFNTDSVPGVAYESKPYRKALNLFHFHSWIPIGIDIQNVSASPGVTLLSQNLLGTTVTAMGYLYDRNQRNGKYYLSITNESVYPAIDFNLDYGDRRDIQIINLNDTIPIKWKELNLSAGLGLPLKWSHNLWLRTFQPSISLNYKYLRMDEAIPMHFTHDKIIAVNYFLKAANMMKTSLRDLYPHWGQQLQINFNNTPFENGYNTIFAGQVTLDFPGIARHHGLRLYGGYQKKTENYYTFSDYIIFPRGYDQIFRNEIVNFSALYSMPLFSPDWQLKHFLFIKRFKTSVFYDYARSADQVLPRVFSSTGFDLTMDFSLFNFIAPFDAGLRSAYISETGKMKFQVLFTLNLNSIY
jgi:hypothetical protein